MMREWAEKTLGGMSASKYYRRIMADDMCPTAMTRELRAVARKNKWVVEVKKRNNSVVVRVVTKAKPPTQKKPSISMKIKEVMESMKPKTSYVFNPKNQIELESARRAVYTHNHGSEFSTSLSNDALLIIRG